MIPEAVLTALDKLNAHARTYGCGKRAIYAYKELAAQILVGAGAATIRPVALMAKCRRCYSTGWFHWDDEKTDRKCRTCGGKGNVHLRFVETTFGAHIWHHPWEHGGLSLFQIIHGDRCYYNAATRAIDNEATREQIPFESVGDWKPNSGGVRRQGDAAAVAFNTVEDWLLSLHDGDWRVRRACEQISIYPLDVGRIGIFCHYCGSADVYSGQRRCRNRLEWSVPTCRQHSYMPLAEWDPVCPPEAITPAVAKWLARRETAKVPA